MQAHFESLDRLVRQDPSLRFRTDELGVVRHLYVRLQNRGPELGDATNRVYFSPASAFSTPASWQLIGTLAEAGIAPGALRIAGNGPDQYVRATRWVSTGKASRSVRQVSGSIRRSSDRSVTSR